MLALGLGAGVLSGLFGIGGGAVLVPALIFFGGFGMAQASGISLAAMLAPVGILGVWEYVRSGRLERVGWMAALWVALGLFGGAFLGAKWSEPVFFHPLAERFCPGIAFCGFSFVVFKRRRLIKMFRL
jgi:hypothetical protein